MHLSMQNVIWDIMSIIGSFFITVFAFGVGLVSIFGIFEDDATHFSDFDNAFKTLFWIIFDPGQWRLFCACMHGD